MRHVYLDGASNTPLDRTVFRAMKPFLSNKWVGNTKSIHFFGQLSDAVLERCREQISEVLCVDAKSVIFTSGATESNNTVIKSYTYNFLSKANKIKKQERKNQIICLKTDHSSIINCCKQVENLGMDIVYVSTIDEIVHNISDKTCLVCFSLTNNETGERVNAERVAKVCKQFKIDTLVDCTQGLSCGGKYLRLGHRYPSVTYFTFSGHKIYGPTGVGCLIANKTSELVPLIVGGSQEFGYRGSTTNLASIVGLCKALTKLSKQQFKFKFYKLREYLTTCLSKTFPDAYINLADRPVEPNIISLNMSNYFDLDQLASALALYGIAVSASSACDSEHDEASGEFNPSHVLVSMGLTEDEIRNTIRISFTKYTTYKDIRRLVAALEEAYNWYKKSEL